MLHWEHIYHGIEEGDLKKLTKLRKKIDINTLQERIRTLCKYHLRENGHELTDDCPTKEMRLAISAALNDILRIELAYHVTNPYQFSRKNTRERIMDPATIEAVMEQEEYSDGRPAHISNKLQRMRKVGWTTID